MPREGVSFDSSWRQRSAIRPGSITEVDRFIRAHYLKKRPAVTVLTLVVDVDGIASGAVVFSLPPRETERRYGVKVWELARLYLIDGLPKNAETWVIGAAIRYIKKHHRDVGALVSYADPSVGHQGTIYKASNWASDGRTDEGRKTPRFDMVTTESDLFGDKIKKHGRASHVPFGAEAVRLPRVSKSRFVFRLHKAGADVHLDEK